MGYFRFSVAESCWAVTIYFFLYYDWKLHGGFKITIPFCMTGHCILHRILTIVFAIVQRCLYRYSLIFFQDLVLQRQNMHFFLFNSRKHCQIRKHRCNSNETGVSIKTIWKVHNQMKSAAFSKFVYFLE